MPKRSKRPYEKPLLLVLVLITLLFIANIIYTSEVAQRDQRFSNQHLADLVLLAASQMNKPLIEDPSGKQYVPEARLVWPANDNYAGELVYQYDPASGGLKQEVHVASKADMVMASGPLLNAGTSSKTVLAAVPKLESCARGVELDFQAQAGRTATDTKHLPHGQTIYFYTETECSDPTLLSYLEQVTSY